MNLHFAKFNIGVNELGHPHKHGISSCSLLGREIVLCALPVEEPNMPQHAALQSFS